MHLRGWIAVFLFVLPAFAGRTLNPASRQTSLTLTELMYRPAGTANLEFVELHNTDPVPLDLSGFRLSGSADFTFPSNTLVDPGGFLVVAADPDLVRSACGATNVVGPWTGELPDAGGTVRLRNAWGAELLRVDYRDSDPWPVAADGAGPSLVLARPDYGVDDPRAWDPSAFTGGSCGQDEPQDNSPYSGVVINEFVAHTDPDLDRIELYNAGTQSVDLAGCRLTDSAAAPGYVLPPGSSIAPGNFLALDETQFGFRLSMSGEKILLYDPAGTRLVDAVRFEAQQRGIATGRYPDGAPGFHELVSPTPGATNAALWIRDIVINEIMFRPLSGNDDEEYIELYNRGTNAADLSNWRLADGVSFSFPEGTSIPAGGYLVVARDATHLRALYRQLNATNAVGNYSGRLSNSGERIALVKPDDPALPCQDFVVVDEVTYSDGWGQWADGGGSSLELMDPRSDNRLAGNWAGSDESRKAEWTYIGCTGVLANGSGTAEELNVLQLGAGECLVDGIEILKLGEYTNRVAPSDFESTLDGWTCWGNHARSTRESGEGYSSGGSLHVRATEGGRTTTATYPLGNYDRIWKAVAPAPQPGETFVIRARARWICGWPYATLSLKGFWMEAAARLAVPQDPGTPGLANSRASTNAPPAVWELTHAPVLPAAGEDVAVTCRAHDPDRVAAMRLQYRLDPSTSYTAVAMAQLPGGLYRATIPGQPAGQIACFRIEAVDGAAAPATNLYPDASILHDALVRFGETRTNSVFGHYTLWVSSANVLALASRPIQSNEPVDATFVGDDCRILYNATVRYRGNFRHFTNITDAAYAIGLPGGERFLGDQGLAIDIPSLQFPNGTFQQERHAYWMAQDIGHPASHLRFVRVHANGSNLFRHDLQVAGRDFVRSWYGDDDPAVHKEEKPLDPFARYVTPDGEPQRSTYRFVLEKANRSQPDDDYGAVYRLAAALNGTNAAVFAARVSALANPDGWARYFAVNHAAGNSDSYGFGESFLHNLYAYIPPRGRSALHLQDMDSSFSSNDARLLPDAAYPIMAKLFANPLFGRAYWRALSQLANGPMTASRSDARLDAWRAALLADGVPAESPDRVDPNTGKTMRQWIADRRAYILQAMTATNASVSFAIATNGGADFSTDEKLLTLQGTAPVTVEQLRLNGSPCRVTWDSLTTWRMRTGLQPGANTLAFAGVDRFGAQVGAASISITCNASNAAPTPGVEFSEIMYHPAPGGAEFVEIHNVSPGQPVDLSGWRVDGLDFTFDAGAVLDPGGYAVIVASTPAYASVYSNAEAVIGEYSGNLGNAGRTLRLERPEPGGGWSLVTAARYEDAWPWPEDADGLGSSLQRVDETRASDHIGNWQAVDPNENREWTFVSVTGRSSSSLRTIGSADIRVYLNGAGSLRVDGLSLVAGAAPEVGANQLSNGEFETLFSGPWVAAGNHATSQPLTGTAHGGSRALQLVASSPGLAPSHCVRQPVPGLAINQTYTLSYWYYPSSDVTGLTVEVSQTDIVSRHSVAPPPPTTVPATPGASNSVSRVLPPLPRVWISEVMSSNISYVADGVLQFDPWVEIYNAETSRQDLAGIFLSNDAAAPGLWAFPEGAALEAGERRLVWADGETNQAAPGEWHASFQLHGTTGIVTLASQDGAGFVLLDALGYSGIPANSSFGNVPDDDPWSRMIMHYPSPGTTNRATSVPALVRINEWMADNQATLRDPADEKFQDWFELYNPGPEADLSGYWLTDALSNSRNFAIPGGTRIPAGGFLLVWADGEPEQNSLGRGLHTDFKLEKSGEALGVYAPDGTLVDAVTFGPQAQDRSEGRWPDGTDPVRLQWIPTPGLSNQGLVLQPQSGNPQPTALQWTSRAGSAYLIEYRDDLLTGSWQTGSVVTAEVGSANWSDPAATNLPHRFYRLTELP